MDKVKSRLIFLEEFRSQSRARSPLIDAFTEELAANHLIDLKPQVGHFSDETTEALTREAARRWAEVVKPTDDRLELAKEWASLATHYHQNAMWGHGTLKQKEKAPKKSMSLATSMIVSVFVSFVFAKVAVLAAASRASQDPSVTNEVVLAIVILASFANLFYFAFKHGRKADQSEH